MIQLKQIFTTFHKILLFQVLKDNRSVVITTDFSLLDIGFGHLLTKCSIS
jgi:hypothetical protein